MDFRKHAAGAYQKASGKTPPPPGPGLVKTKAPLDQGPQPGQEIISDEKPSRGEIARYLILIGPDEATKVLKHLGDKEVEALAKEIATIESVGAEESRHVLARFKGLVRQTVITPAKGGADVARQLLTAAFGQEKAEAIATKALKGEVEPFFAYLLDLDPGHIYGILKSEPIHVRTMVLAYIPPALAAAILKASNPVEQKEIIRRLATMKRVDKDVLVRVHDALKERIRNASTLVKDDLDGRSSLAAIMRHLDPGLEQSLLDDLADEAPDLAHDIRERLFTIDTILLIDNRDFQKVLSALDDKVIAMLLKGKTDPIKRKFLDNVSDARSLTIQDELLRLGPQPRRDVDRATRDFIVHLKDLEAQGIITLLREDEEYV